MPPSDEPQPSIPTDVLTATGHAVAHADAVIAALAARTHRLRERWITGPSPSPGPDRDGLLARVQIRVELVPDTDVPAAVDDVVALLRGRGVELPDPLDRGGHRHARGRAADGAEVEVDGAVSSRWLALLWVTAPSPAPPGVASPLDLEAVFLDRVDPAGERFRDR